MTYRTHDCAGEYRSALARAIGIRERVRDALTRDCQTPTRWVSVFGAMKDWTEGGTERARGWGIA